MATTISWTDETWNPVTGCSHVSDGCKHCYAERLSLRFGWSKQPWTANHAAENVVLHPDRLDQPLRWRRPRRIFVNSMSDLFHEQIPDAYIDQVFARMRVASLTYGHIFQVLTKRPQRMQKYIAGASDRVRHLAPPKLPEGWYRASNWRWPLEHVWLGVSVEDQRRVDERIPLLLQTPAAVRFLSCEPLLGPIDLGEAMPCGYYCHEPEDPESWGHIDHPFWTPGRAVPELHWIIAGGESGPGYRPMNLDWARSIRDQCISAGVPFFFKQASGPRPGMGATLDGMEHHEFPAAAFRYQEAP